MDKVGDMIIRLKNGSKRKLTEVNVKNSKYNKEILDCLTLLGFIIGYKEVGRNLEVSLKYKQNEGVIEDCWRISKPGRRMYMSYKELDKYGKEKKIIVYSSSKGILSTISYKFKIDRVGGEPLFGIK